MLEPPAHTKQKVDIITPSSVVELLKPESPVHSLAREDYSQLTTLIDPHYPFTPDNENGNNEITKLIQENRELSMVPNFHVGDDLEMMD